MKPRLLTLGAMIASTALLVIPVAIHWHPVLIWNASGSVPKGLYHLQSKAHLGVNDLVAVMPPAPIAAYLADRNYLPQGVPLLKHIAALSGQSVCRIHLFILIDGIQTGIARERDRQNRPLPDWQGCRVITDREVFLLNWESTDSLDGRYFGPLPIDSIIGRAVPLWTFGAQE
jgi:conjugative transfer signal peptidase TraF